MRNAGLMWSTNHREDRKTHVFVDPDVLPLCNPGLYEAFLWDWDLAIETQVELLARVESTDPDGIVCKSCVRALNSRNTP